MVTIDASVLVAADTADETGHVEALAFLRRLLASGSAIHEPTLAIVEVTAAVARRTSDAALARAAGLQVMQLPGAVFHALDAETAAIAASLAGDLRLRGADAVYAATALMHDVPLITFDVELAERAGALIRSLTPAAWLERNPT